MTAGGGPVRREEGRSLMLDAAMRRYQLGQRIEIASLSAELSIGRASAYRWFGDNDQLLAEVLIVRIQENFRKLLLENANRSGHGRVIAVIEGCLNSVATSEKFGAVLKREPKRALKVVASEIYPVRDATVRLIEELLADERSALRLQPSRACYLIASTIVRLLESYLYSYVILGEEPNIRMAMERVAIIVPEDVLTRQDTA